MFYRFFNPYLHILSQLVTIVNSKNLNFWPKKSSWKLVQTIFFCSHKFLWEISQECGRLQSSSKAHPILKWFVSIKLGYLYQEFSRHGKLYDDADIFGGEEDPSGRVRQSTEDGQREDQVGPTAADHRGQIQVEHADDIRLLLCNLQKTH